LLHSAHDAELRERFRHEATVAMRLSSSNQRLVKVYELGEENGQPFIVMELVEGDSLEDLIRAQAPLPLTHALHVLRGIAEGVQELHQQRHIHRDLKPSNILLGNGKGIKITDFGLVYELASERRTQEGKFWASFAYAAPEQRENGTLAAATDIYALGVILFELLTKEHLPMGSETVRSRLLRLDVPLGGIHLVEEMIQRASEKRPRDASALLRHIDSCLKASRNQKHTQPHPAMGGAPVLVTTSSSLAWQSTLLRFRAAMMGLLPQSKAPAIQSNEPVARQYSPRDTFLPTVMARTQTAKQLFIQGLGEGAEGAVLGLMSGTLGGVIGGLAGWKSYWLIRSIENGVLRIFIRELGQGIFSDALIKALLDFGSWWLGAAIVGAILGTILGFGLGISRMSRSQPAKKGMGRAGRAIFGSLSGAIWGAIYGISYRGLALIAGSVLAVFFGESYRRLLIGPTYTFLQEVTFWLLCGSIGFAILGALDGAFEGELLRRRSSKLRELIAGVLIGSLMLGTGGIVLRMLSEGATIGIAEILAWLTQNGIRAQIARVTHEAAVGAVGGGLLSLRRKPAPSNSSEQGRNK
nr:serine/threonine protein kinase [Ardenticatenales bacterium]